MISAASRRLVTLTESALMSTTTVKSLETATEFCITFI